MIPAHLAAAFRLDIGCEWRPRYYGELFGWKAEDPGRHFGGTSTSLEAASALLAAWETRAK